VILFNKKAVLENRKVSDVRAEWIPNGPYSCIYVWIINASCWRKCLCLARGETKLKYFSRQFALKIEGVL